ncbi:MAG: acyl-CoA thioesterase, partial [Pseudomonadota bacterium]
MTQTFLGAKNYESAALFHRLAWTSDTDELGHVNNAIYVKWLQDVGVAHWNALATGALKEKHVWICRRHEIDYREPVHASDQVELRTWLGKHAGPKFDRHVDIRKSGTDRWSVQAVTTWVLLDKETGRSP